MAKLVICQCPECGTEFAMHRQDLEEVGEVTCPLCEEVFVPPAEEEGVAEEEEEEPR